jgi:ABC-type antimicrobial peptide transport system permease subunit
VLGRNHGGVFQYLISQLPSRFVIRISELFENNLHRNFDCTKELGAQRGAVVWMVLRRVLLLAAVGLAISVPAALSASQLVKSFLFETQPNDPGTLALAGVVLLSAAILAGYAPARRASRIDPLAALRHE